MKTIIVEGLISDLKERLEIIKKAIQENQVYINDSPSAMNSWSDTSRFQFEQTNLYLEKTQDEIKAAIEQLKQVDLAAGNGKTVLGSLVRLMNGGKESSYFIAPVGAGTKTIQETVVISIDSPLARILLDKKKGDRVEFGADILTVISVI